MSKLFMPSSNIDRLFTYPGRSIQSFDAMQELDQRLNHPHRAFRSIHVGGTNGKGSTVTKIAEALQYEGYKVGLYTSPHISTFRERIQIQGKMIPEETAERLLSPIFSVLGDLSVSFFDLLTALAFLYFAEERVDFASVEVGLGGRLDATNVIDPVLAVITSIGLEHTHFLGDSLEKIAVEKGAIGKPGIPLIVGPKALPFFPQGISAPSTTGVFYDLENQSIARRALEQLGISSSSIEKGILIRPPCRFEIRGPYILDVAHNPDAFERLIEALAYHFPGKTFPFFLAFSQDKDWRRCLEIVRPVASQVTFVHNPFPRLVKPEILAAAYPGSQISDVFGEGVIAGSFYLMDAARKQIFRSKEESAISDD